MRVADLAGVLIVSLWAAVAQAFEIEEQIFYPATPETAVLRIISTADRVAFEPVIHAFQAENPGLSIDYIITGTTDLMRALYDEGAVFDLAISSAMDLQTKLANDGLVQTYSSGATQALPDWAGWRNQLFAFTQEPAIMVLSTREFTPQNAPRTRDALVAMLRENPERFKGRIGTYDVRTSGFGYLMATQDSRQGETFWQLMEVMGRLDARLYCCSGDMIRDVAEGRLALAYNVLGSYAASERATTDGFFIVEFEDYVNVMLRTVLIPAGAENQADARRMVDFLATMSERPDLVAQSGLPAINDAALRANNALRPIRFGPGLLVFLDRLKRQKFVESWESSMEQE